MFRELIRSSYKLIEIIANKHELNGIFWIGINEFDLKIIEKKKLDKIIELIKIWRN